MAPVLGIYERQLKRQPPRLQDRTVTVEHFLVYVKKKKKIDQLKVKKRNSKQNTKTLLLFEESDMTRVCCT